MNFVLNIEILSSDKYCENFFDNYHK